MCPTVRLLALIFGAVLSLSLANAQETIKVAEREMLPADRVHGPGSAPSNITHRLTLTLVYFSGGNWSRDAVTRTAENAAKILEQCGVRLGQVELVRVDAPQRYHYYETPASRELARTLQLAKPTVYFITDTRQQPAFDAEAIGRGNSGTRPELADTVWVTRATRDADIALAHELTHVLANSGEHVELPGNLMRDETAAENTRLTAGQCDQLRKTGTKNGLLRESRANLPSSEGRR